MTGTKTTASPTPTALIITVGNELLAGEIVDSNAGWLAKALTATGAEVTLIAALPDDAERLSTFLRREHSTVDLVVVAGGLGGTPDDITREGVARAFGLEPEVDPIVAASLRAAGDHAAAFATAWSRMPPGARPLYGAKGGAPGFAIHNVIVLPGVPSEMQAMFGAIERELVRGPARHLWRCVLATAEHRVLHCLEEIARSHPEVDAGSYPHFTPAGAEVEIVLRARRPEALAAAAALVERTAAADGTAMAVEQSSPADQSSRPR